MTTMPQTHHCGEDKTEKKQWNCVPTQVASRLYWYLQGNRGRPHTVVRARQVFGCVWPSVRQNCAQTSRVSTKTSQFAATNLRPICVFGHAATIRLSPVIYFSFVRHVLRELAHWILNFGSLVRNTKGRWFVYALKEQLFAFKHNRCRREGSHAAAGVSDTHRVGAFSVDWKTCPPTRRLLPRREQSWFNSTARLPSFSRSRVGGAQLDKDDVIWCLHQSGSRNISIKFFFRWFFCLVINISMLEKWWRCDFICFQHLSIIYLTKIKPCQPNCGSNLLKD